MGVLTHHWLSSTMVVIKNYGISFGIGGWVFILLSVIFLVILSLIWWNNNFLGISLIVIGGWINLFDRVVFGYVRDYWQLGSVYNNIADWIIQIGVIIFLLEIWIIKSK